MINELAHWLIELTGMQGVAMSPKAGAHGELCGILCIRAALEARGDAREVILVPESAHGTNPASCTLAGFKVATVKSDDKGLTDMDDLRAHLNDDTAGFMVTNPNTLGLFEENIEEMEDARDNQVDAMEEAGEITEDQADVMDDQTDAMEESMEEQADEIDEM